MRGGNQKYPAPGIADSVSTEPPSSPWGAALLSFLFPGLGQVYAHEFVKGCLLFTLAMAVAVFVFPIGAPAFIALYLRQPWPIAWFVAGAPTGPWEPLALVSVIVLAPASWMIWFGSVVHAYEAAARHNERFASVVCKVCGTRVPSDVSECSSCGAPVTG